MNRYEFSAFVIAEAETEEKAKDLIEEMTYAINKDPDGPRVYLDDGPAYVEETDE